MSEKRYVTPSGRVLTASDVATLVVLFQKAAQSVPMAAATEAVAPAAAPRVIMPKQNSVVMAPVPVAATSTFRSIANKYMTAR